MGMYPSVEVIAIITSKELTLDELFYELGIDEENHEVKVDDEYWYAVRSDESDYYDYEEDCIFIPYPVVHGWGDYIDVEKFDEKYDKFTNEVYKLIGNLNCDVKFVIGGNYG